MSQSLVRYEYRDVEIFKKLIKVFFVFIRKTSFRTMQNLTIRKGYPGPIQNHVKQLR